MVREYEAYAEEVGVFELAPGQTARKQLTINAMKTSLSNYLYPVLGLVAAAAALGAGLARALWLRLRSRRVA